MGALITAPFEPFLIASAVMFGLILIEGLSLAFGASISGLLDGLSGAKGIEDVGFLQGSLGWLNVGKVPLLALLILMLALFSAWGVLIQVAASTVFAPLPAWIASIVSLVVTIPVTRTLSVGVARLIPKDETYVAEMQDFIGRTGVVSLGPVRRDSVARMKISDRWHNWHFPRVRSANPGDEFAQGSTVLVVDAVGQELLVVAADTALLPEARQAETAS